MTMKCPACGRSEESASSCGRCGADLSGLRGVAAAAARRESRGLSLLREGDSDRAVEESMGANRLRRSERSQRLVAVSLACAGRYRATLKALLVHRKTIQKISGGADAG